MRSAKYQDPQTSENSVDFVQGEIIEQTEDSLRTETRDQLLICRLCGKTGSDYVPIFGNDDLSIAEKISRCLPIIVLSTDDLPSHVCPACLCNLNISFKLIVTSTRVDSRLRRQLTESRKIRKNARSLLAVNILRDVEESQVSTTDNILDTYTNKLKYSNVIYGPMECEMCNITFTDMEKFDNHVETKHLLSWCCSLCDKSFETSEKLVAHKESDHAGNVLICTRCVDEERLAHGLISLAEMQNSRKCVKRATAKTSRKRNAAAKTLDEGEKTAEKTVEEHSKEMDNSDNKKNDRNTCDATLHAMCDICKIAFGTDELLEAHRRIHQPNTVRCYMCHVDAPSIYELFIHKREIHHLYKRVQLKFVCETCGKYFSNNWQWLNHQREANCKKRASSHTCKYCHSEFSTNLKLTRHLRKHKEEMLKDPAVTIYQCVACPKVFVDKEFYQKHRNREHRKKHFDRKCDHCEETFEKLQLFAEHMKDVHNLEPNFNLSPKKQYTSDCFVCKYCGKKLSTYQSLLDHEHIHTGEKPYPCKICGKSFRSYTSRWAHAQRHVKGTFICEHCGKTFCYKNNLSAHMRVHRPVENRKHRCAKCDKLFLRKAHLIVHMRIHDGVRPYTCDICNFSFTQIGDMRRHRARHAIREYRARKPRTKAISISPSKNDDTS